MFVGRHACDITQENSMSIAQAFKNTQTAVIPPVDKKPTTHTHTYTHIHKHTNANTHACTHASGSTRGQNTCIDDSTMRPMSRQNGCLDAPKRQILIQTYIGVQAWSLVGTSVWFVYSISSGGQISFPLMHHEKYLCTAMYDHTRAHISERQSTNEHFPTFNSDHISPPEFTMLFERAGLLCFPVSVSVFLSHVHTFSLLLSRPLALSLALALSLSRALALSLTLSRALSLAISLYRSPSLSLSCF